jgi:hypothetical protein
MFDIDDKVNSSENSGGVKVKQWIAPASGKYCFHNILFFL